MKNALIYTCIFYISIALLLAGAGKKKPPHVTPAEQESLEGLIQTETEGLDFWDDPEGGLPLMTAIGDRTGFMLHASFLTLAGKAQLCEAVQFDEILDLKQGETVTGEVILDTRKPRVKEILSDACFIRPGNPLIAVGFGWQDVVTLQDFTVRPAQLRRANDSPYVLWGGIDGTLREAPLFYSTDFQLPIGENRARPFADYSRVPLTSPLKTALTNEVEFLDEYEVTVVQLGAENCDHILHLKKREPSPDDKDLPKEMLFSEKDGRVDLLIQDKVAPQMGSGQVRVEGVFDFNKDGHADLVVKGVHLGCPFLAVFQGLEVGFEKVDIPIIPCS